MRTRRGADGSTAQERRKRISTAAATSSTTRRTRGASRAPAVAYPLPPAVAYPLPPAVAYPLPEFGGVFSRNVCVFRGGESSGFPVLREPKVVSVVTAAAYRLPPVLRSPEGRAHDVMDEAHTLGTARKIHALLAAAQTERVDVLVLGALGCGVFANPPHQVARLFKAALAGPFRGAFRRVVFAVTDRHARDDGVSNLAAFAQVLNS
eukprot:TRINITY_DN8347_c0_g1_i2.p3 TRINITY_DN8347_c0_g1~~TRINITY_DN8347_c0_g1_i2.p3  ORF type:complete len:207 (+),score=45.60 TRINITY_DN8347_c0_g1_i2:758-1378(+)